jgi:hypothetical protein
LKAYKNPAFDNALLFGLEKRVVKIRSKNHLLVMMDYGESE